MKYLLDTNICIYIIKQKPQSVIDRLKTEAIEDIGISVITLCELEYGVEKSANQAQNRAALLRFLAPITIVEFNDAAAYCYGEIRAGLEKKGELIGSMDLLIAAHALANRFTLVTNNEKEFTRITNLKVENWV